MLIFHLNNNHGTSVFKLANPRKKGLNEKCNHAGITNKQFN